MDRLRHRDRLFSLKHSTIEACFSVPMLNLTLPSFPFVLAFAVKGLGWKAEAVGAMAALNPMLSIMAVGELALTPRGLFALGRRSLRSVRQQVKAIEDVGHELAEGGREILNRSLPR